MPTFRHLEVSGWVCFIVNARGNEKSWKPQIIFLNECLFYYELNHCLEFPPERKCRCLCCGGNMVPSFDLYLNLGEINLQFYWLLADVFFIIMVCLRSHSIARLSRMFNCIWCLWIAWLVFTRNLLWCKHWVLFPLSVLFSIVWLSAAEVVCC